MPEKNNNTAFVNWFRHSAPYIKAHRGRRFVVTFGGEMVADARFPHFVHDVALLNTLGVRLVLVPGARPQIEARLRERGIKTHYHNGLRVTHSAALACVKEAVGAVRIEIEALLSTGLANSPMAGAHIRVVSGNFVTARPLGVRGGVDYEHTGEVRRVDTQAINKALDDGAIALVSPLGYSPTGEVFNLSAEDVATAIAMDVHADKLICLTSGPGILDARKRLLRQLTLKDAEQLLSAKRALGEDIKRHLASAVQACRKGVRRAHLVSRRTEGVLLLELFTRDGVGTLIAADAYEDTRAATIDDVGGILELIAPLEEEGILVRRSRERLETEIGHFTVMERDGMIIACAALYPYLDEGGRSRHPVTPRDVLMSREAGRRERPSRDTSTSLGVVAELACLAVHPDYRNVGRGEALLEFVERTARQQKIGRLFVLTTHTAHWFVERGFKAADSKDLPVARRALYNYQRNAKVFVKKIG